MREMASGQRRGSNSREAGAEVPVSPSAMSSGPNVEILPPPPRKFVRRPYEQAALVALRERRQLGLFWSRRARKSTTLGSICFEEMSKGPGRMCVAASASLLLGREVTSFTLTAVEQAMLVFNEAAALHQVFDAGAEEQGLDLKIADSESGKILTGLTPEDFAGLYHSNKMELWLFFDRTAYSRLQVIAPNPATARSWRALVVRDEAGNTQVGLEEALRVATDAMMRDTPDLKIVYACDSAPNDKHPWFTSTLPRELTEGSEEEQFPPNPEGHFYIGQHNFLIHRVGLQDAYECGHRLYDDKSQVMTLEQARKHAQIAAAWDISYGLNHKTGGSAAIDLFALLSAQERGIGKCSFVYVRNDSDFQAALEDLARNLGSGPVGVGHDIATTVKNTSNPSCTTVTEGIGTDRAQRLVVFWKEKKADIAEDRLIAIFKTIAARPVGGRARAFKVAAQSERYYADRLEKVLRALVPTESIIESKNVEPRPPGYEDDINFKTFLGDIYSAAVNDNRYSMPPGEYFKDDQRMTVKNAGRYECDPNPSNGMHGDSFVSGGCAEYALAGPGAAIGESVNVRANERQGGRRPAMSRNVGAMV
jgi:hypothetical protein